MLQNISTSLIAQNFSPQNFSLPPQPSTLEIIFYYALFFPLLFGLVFLQQKLFWKLATFVAARPVWDMLDQWLKTKWLPKRALICFTICCVVGVLACWLHHILLHTEQFNIKWLLNLSPYCALWLALWLFLWYFASMVIQVGLGLPVRIASETEIQPLNRVISFFMFFHIFFLLLGERVNFDKLPQVVDYDVFVSFQRYLQYSICIALLVTICIFAYRKNAIFKPLIMLLVAELMTVKLLSVGLIAQYSSVSFILVGVIGIIYFCFRRYEGRFVMWASRLVGVFLVFDILDTLGILLFFEGIFGRHSNIVQGLRGPFDITFEIMNFLIDSIFPSTKGDPIGITTIIILILLTLFLIAAFFMSVKIARAIYKFKLAKNTI